MKADDFAAPDKETIKLQACKNVVTEKFGVHSMRLFGSVVRNEQNESSDVDICVEMDPSLLRRSGLKIYLEELLNCKVDVLRVHKNTQSVPSVASDAKRKRVLLVWGALFLGQMALGNTI